MTDQWTDSEELVNAKIVADTVVKTSKTPEELLGQSPQVANPRSRPTAERLREIAKLAGKELEKPAVVPEQDRPKQEYDVT